MNLHVHTRDHKERFLELVFNSEGKCLKVMHASGASIEDHAALGGVITGCITAEDAAASRNPIDALQQDYQPEALIESRFCLVIIRPNHDDPFVTDPIIMARNEKTSSNPPQIETVADLPNPFRRT